MSSKFGVGFELIAYQEDAVRSIFHSTRCRSRVSTSQASIATAADFICVSRSIRQRPASHVRKIGSSVLRSMAKSDAWD